MADCILLEMCLFLDGCYEEANLRDNQIGGESLLLQDYWTTGKYVCKGFGYILITDLHSVLFLF